MYGLYLLSADLEVENFLRINPSLLYQCPAADHDEELPFRIVPVLPFGYPRSGDVDTELSAVRRPEKFSKRSALVYVHLQREHCLFLGEVAQVC